MATHMTSTNGPAGSFGSSSRANLWLAIGDETGSFEDPPSASMHGVGLILARPATLLAALDENLDGRTIRSRMDAPVEGLRSWLLSQGAEKADELTKHHVREAWLYLRSRKEVAGEYSLDATPSDPVLTHLLAAFRWLAGHPGIVSLGIHGSGKEVMTDFSTGSDPMATIGALYGRILALVRPFLGSSPRIRVLPGCRTEETNTASILRAGRDVSGPSSGGRLATSKTGGNRTLLETMERQFWATLATTAGHWPVPSTAAARQIAFAGSMNKTELVSALEREDAQAAKLLSAEESRLNNLADLACSLMAASCDSAVRDLRIRFPDPVGPNVRFFSAREVMA
jgi:hypothetical protein